MVSYLRNCYENQNSILHCMWPWVLPTDFLNKEFLSQPDLMLYTSIYNTLRLMATKITFLTNFCLGVELVRGAVCFYAIIVK